MNRSRILDGLISDEIVAAIASEIADNAALLVALNDYADKAISEYDAEWREYYAMTRAYTDED